MTIPAGYKCNQWGLFYKTDNSGPYYLDADGVMTQGLPNKFYTDNNGPNARLRVDVGQTGFFAGREFRTFHEFAIPQSAIQVYRLQCPVNMILNIFTVTLLLGDVRIEAVTGGTPGGVFGTVVPVLPANGMSTTPGYVGQATVATGGTHVGGTVRDLLHCVAGNNIHNTTAQFVETDAPVGRAAIPLYIRVTNLDNVTANGILKLRWEERP